MLQGLKGGDLENIPTAGASPEMIEAEEAYYRAAIADLFAQMDVIDERIKRSQSETARLRAETREILGRIERDMEGGRGQAPPLRGS